VRHRFEEDHACIPLDEAVEQALAQARTDMGEDAFIVALRTLHKVFSNVLNDRGNPKYRHLNKAKAGVQEKLSHPACIRALELGGFQDMGAEYVCREQADLGIMEAMRSALEKHKELIAPPSAPKAAAGAVATGSGGSGARLVNGVLIRRPPPGPSAAAGRSPQQAAAPSLASQSSLQKGSAAKAKSAFDFQRRGGAEEAARRQAEALNEARMRQKEKYKDAANGSAPPTQAASAAGGAGTTAKQSTDSSGSQDGCVLQ